MNPLKSLLRYVSVGLILWVLHGCSSQQPQPYEAVFVPSENPVLPIKKGQEYTFGYLEVPENRQVSGSNTIRLPVYIFKSRSANPNPDPVIYTVGGPGYTSMRAAQYMQYYRYLDTRDLILFEQRGTQYAQPNLACPEWSRAIALTNRPGITERASDSLMNQAALDCRNRLTKEGIDLDGYRTTESAADIADLVKALDIKQYNLLTLSYSTKIAQTMLRDYPEGIRSVVMDSPLPLEVNYDEESVKNLMGSIDAVLSDCALDPSCQQAFPELKERFKAFLIEKTRQPLEISLTDPESGERLTFALQGKDIVALYGAVSTSEMPGLPLEISKLLNGDLRILQEAMDYVFNPPGDGNGLGMRLSVWCAEELPFADPLVISEESLKYPEVEGLSPAVFKASVCEIWDVEKAAARENEAVRSEVPVLLINGEYDNETPPFWAAAMQENLPNSFHLIFRGWRHGPTTNWGNPCAMEAAHAFFNDPSERPEPDCLQKLGPVKFLTE